MCCAATTYVDSLQQGLVLLLELRQSPLPESPQLPDRALIVPRHDVARLGTRSTQSGPEPRKLAHSICNGFSWGLHGPEHVDRSA
jgi:hypothetical protein